MRSIGVYLIHLVRIGVALSSLTMSATAMARDYSVEEMNEFLLAWKQTMVAFKEPEAKQYAENNRALAEAVANGLGGRARAALKENDRASALALFTATAKLFEHLDDTHGMAVASYDFGAYYLSGEDCEQALPHFIRALHFFQSLKMHKPREGSAQEIQLCVLKVVIQDTSINAIANLKVSPEGRQFVVYNREKCEQAGIEVCMFYLMHEYGHVFLEHATNHVPSERSEPEADCWAAKHIQSEMAKAAYAWFLKGAVSPKVHGSSQTRAEGIRRCAGL